jgi:hypothetical protein
VYLSVDALVNRGSLDLISAVLEANSVPACLPTVRCRACLQVYLSVDALVNRGSLDLIGAVLEANSVLDSLSPDGQKARKARQQRELQEAGAGQFRQITR